MFFSSNSIWEKLLLYLFILHILLLAAQGNERSHKEHDDDRSRSHGDDKHKDGRHRSRDKGDKVGEKHESHKYEDDVKHKTINVIEGQTATMKCPKSSDSSETIVWKGGHSEVLFYGDKVITDHNRFRSYQDILYIYNVTKYDEKTYSCSHRSGPTYTFKLDVTELQCYEVSKLDNGHVVYYPEVHKDYNYVKYGTKVLYFCDSGYSLLGPDVRHCTDPDYGWTRKAPSCENAYIVGLEYRLAALEKLYENYAGTYSTMSERVTVAEDESRHQFTLLEYMLHDFATFRSKTDQHREKLETELRSLRLAVLQQRYQQQRLITPNPSYGGPIYFNEGIYNARGPHRFY